MFLKGGETAVLGSKQAVEGLSESCEGCSKGCSKEKSVMPKYCAKGSVPDFYVFALGQNMYEFLLICT